MRSGSSARREALSQPRVNSRSGRSLGTSRSPGRADQQMLVGLVDAIEVVLRPLPVGRNQLVVLQRFIDVVEAGKRQGTIREDADPRVVGWSLMGLGWTKDLALLQGLDEFITDGTADAILENVLDRIAVRPGDDLKSVRPAESPCRAGAYSR